MRPLILVRDGRSVGALPGLDALPNVEVQRVAARPTADDLDHDRPTILLVAAEDVRGGTPEGLEALARVAALIGLGDAGDVEPHPDLAAVPLTSWMAAEASPAIGRTQLQGALRHAATLVAAARAERLERINEQELIDLSSVGDALATERDLDALLGMIVGQSIRLTGADAASLYLVRHAEDSDTRLLHFTLSQNLTLPDLPLVQFDIPIDHGSVAGYVAATGEVLNISDVYELGADVPYQLNRSFDERFGYRTKSMLVIPMRSHRDQTIGVLQLINRKRDPDVRLANPRIAEAQVLPFDRRALRLATALAAHAAVAIENSSLYEDIELLLEGFVTAAVSAIESRDPATSGHSLRVANFTIQLAEAVDRTGDGPYADQLFSRNQLRELRYAALLHDFGKVGVREKVLVKQKKLYGHDLAILRQRFELLMQQADLEFERHRAEWLLANGPSGYADALKRLDATRAGRQQQLQHWLDVIARSNEPTILPEGATEELEVIGQQTWVDRQGIEHPVLTEAEVRFLSIARGNLDVRERREIESHVANTYRFLKMIPWTPELSAVPEIARGHHEKLDGSGYPHGVRAEEIPVQARMMTIADIYDALTAADRPYKRAVTPERALDILRGEADRGLLDQHLLGIFIGAGVFSMLPEGAAASPRRSSGRSRPSLIS